GLPDADTGLITVDGALGSAGELRIIVAQPGSFNEWPTDPFFNVLADAGVRDLGLASTGHNGIVVSDADLRRQTRFAAYLSRDMHGSIELGQVHYIQCGIQGGNPVGTIHANLLALALEQDFGYPSVAHISAGNGISGNITATGDPNTPFPRTD